VPDDVARHASPASLTRETRTRALRHSLWLALVHAAELGLVDIEGAIVALLVQLDQHREALDDGARG
jgi:hypothetical protein